MSSSHPFRQIEARGESFDRSARLGRGANMPAIIDMLNFDDFSTLGHIAFQSESL